MRRFRKTKTSNLEKTVYEILHSKAISKIYVFLIQKNGAKTEEIIKATKLHPSTVRETLSKMYSQKLIQRKKLKNDSIGKNPYLYYPISPTELLSKYAKDIEERLNQLANLAFPKSQIKEKKQIKIKISKRVDNK